MPVLLSRPQPSRKEEVEDWPWLDQAVLRSSRSRQVCMTCHVFGARVHPAAQLKQCRELTREQAIKLWGQKRQPGWQVCPPASPFASPLQDETTLPWPEAP